MPLQQLETALELLPRATGDDLRVILEEKLKAMAKNPSSIQVVVDEQEDGTEKLSLQRLLLSIWTNSTVPSLASSYRPTPQISSSHSISFMKHLVEVKVEQFTKTQVIEFKGSSVGDEGYDKEL